MKERKERRRKKYPKNVMSLRSSCSNINGEMFCEIYMKGYQSLVEVNVTVKLFKWVQCSTNGQGNGRAFITTHDTEIISIKKNIF